jgi:hypothetical protein
MKKLIVILALLSSAILCIGQKINKAEYFIDTDPGFGKATNISISIPANNVSLSYTVNISSLSEGFHMIVVRARDDKGNWSIAQEQVFYVYKAQSATAANIKKAEYFIDTDPGFGKAVNIPVASPAKDIALSFDVNTGSLEGFHVIVLRALDNLGRWSTSRQQIFYVFKSTAAAASNVTGIEYFLDTDPGFGKGTFYSVPVPASKVAAEFTVNLSGVTNGNHVLYFRAKDASGRYSALYAHAITVTLSGIDDVDITSWFRLYPNPNSGDFIMDFTDLQGKSVTLAIYDMRGRQVYLKELDGENVPLSVDLPSGVYLVTVESGGKIFKQKLIISR